MDTTTLQRKGTPVSRREGNQFWRGFTPAATSSFSPAPLSHCSLSLTLFFCLTCQAEKNSFTARKGTICRSGQRITIPAKVCPCEKRSQLPRKAEAIKGLRIPNQDAENYLWAGNPLQTITFQSKAAQWFINQLLAINCWAIKVPTYFI